jgi:hypothetical protein
VGTIATAALAGLLAPSEEDHLLDLAARPEPSLVHFLADAYRSDVGRFAHHARRLLPPVPDRGGPRARVVVVGSGLAGSTAALSLLDLVCLRLGWTRRLTPARACRRAGMWWSSTSKVRVADRADFCR